MSCRQPDIVFTRGTEEIVLVVVVVMFRWRVCFRCQSSTSTRILGPFNIPSIVRSLSICLRSRSSVELK